MFSDDSGIKLSIINRKKDSKPWKLNRFAWVKEEGSKKKVETKFVSHK